MRLDNFSIPTRIGGFHVNDFWFLPFESGGNRIGVIFEPVSDFPFAHIIVNRFLVLVIIRTTKIIGNLVCLPPVFEASAAAIGNIFEDEDPVRVIAVDAES